MLQWGRDVSVAEINANFSALQTCGKLQWGRDVSVAEIAYNANANAARLWALQWGRDVSVAEICTRAASGGAAAEASMGPRRFRRGNFGWPTSGRTVLSQLQWGRDVSVAEMEVVGEVVCVS